jgi:hypothetical protein
MKRQLIVAAAGALGAGGMLFIPSASSAQPPGAANFPQPHGAQFPGQGNGPDTHRSPKGPKPCKPFKGNGNAFGRKHHCASP